MKMVDKLRKQEKNAKLFSYGVLALVVIALAIGLLANKADAAGFRESGFWQFDTPLSKAAKLQSEQIRLLGRGDYFNGSHASKSIYIGEVYVDEVSGSMHLQTNTTVGNSTTVVQQGDGTLTFGGEQTLGDQTGTNTSKDNVVGTGNTSTGGEE